MGLRGPAPKPTAIKRLEGNPGKRKLNEAEPTLTVGVPECPDYLDEVAKREWGRLNRKQHGSRRSGHESDAANLAFPYKNGIHLRARP